MPCIIELSRAKREYEKIRSALEQVEATGYGIVMPSIEELSLEEPEIVRQGGRYGVRLEASAPSIHMMKAVIHTEISPIVGTEKQSEDLVQSLLGRCIQFWQWERCRHGHNGPAVCRSAGRAGADRAADFSRNLVMDSSKLAAQGIRFHDTLSSF